MEEEQKQSGARQEARDMVRELEEEGFKKPSAFRQALPWVLTALILVWVFQNINYDIFIKHLYRADWALLFLVFAFFNIVFAAGDLLSYGMSYRWYASPGISVLEIMRARWGVFLFHALYTPLSTISNLAYLRRKRGTPVLWALSANAFSSVNDLFIINLMLTASLVINHFFPAVPELSFPSEWFWAIVTPCSIVWLVAVGYSLYWFTPVKRLKFLRPLTNAAILRSCRLSRWHHYFKVQGARLMIALAGIAAHGLALYAFHIQVPFPMLFVIGPLMVGISFMPVSALGFGGPQLVAMLLLPYAFDDKSLLTAYSVTFSAFFTGGRSLIGAAFLPGFLKDIRTAAPRAGEDT